MPRCPRESSIHLALTLVRACSVRCFVDLFDMVDHASNTMPTLCVDACHVPRHVTTLASIFVAMFEHLCFAVASSVARHARQKPMFESTTMASAAPLMGVPEIPKSWTQAPCECSSAAPTTRDIEDTDNVDALAAEPEEKMKAKIKSGGEGHAPPTVEVRDDENMTLYKSASEDRVDPRTMLGVRFSRDPEGAGSEDYNARKGRIARSEFRKAWAAQKYKVMVEEKLHTTTEHKKVDTSKGVYRSVKWLIKNEGVDDSKKYVDKCLMLGPPWYEWDAMWERLEFLVMEKSFKGVFTRRWKRDTEEKVEQEPKRAKHDAVGGGSHSANASSSTGDGKEGGAKEKETPKAGAIVGNKK